MSKNEEDYSDYIQYFSNVSNILSLLCGFTFTSTTVLLTLLPDPSEFLSQVTLFVLGFCTNLFVLLIGWTQTKVIYFLKKPPRLPTKREVRSDNIFNLLVFLSSSLIGVAEFLMYLLFNLVYLAVVTAIVVVLFQILGYIVFWRPFIEYRREIYSQCSED